MQKIDKNILIFGGSGLIGSTIYNFLKRENTNLVSADIKNTIKDKHNFIKCDILNSKDIIKAKNLFLKKYKSIDAIINCTYPRSRKFNQNFEVLKKKDLINDLNSHLGTYFEINKIFCNYFKKKIMVILLILILYMGIFYLDLKYIKIQNFLCRFNI